jgi:hypothetical protein
MFSRLASLLLLVTSATSFAGTVQLNLNVALQAHYIAAVDQSTYPYVVDPLFVPYQVEAAVLFDDALLSRSVGPNAASILFGPDLQLISPLTSSLLYVPDGKSQTVSVQSYDYSATSRGAYIDMALHSSEYFSPSHYAVYDWAIVGPTADPLYPPLVDPGSFGTADLLSMLHNMQTTGSTFYYSEMSYEQINISPSGAYYPYADWYVGRASIQTTAVPEPGACTLILVAIGLGAARAIRRRITRNNPTVTNCDSTPEIA